MHIEPGIVDASKIVLSYATAAAAIGLTAKMALDTIRRDGGVSALVLRSVATVALVFCFFELVEEVGDAVVGIFPFSGFVPGELGVGLFESEGWSGGEQGQ